jgi:hypothetical protein
VTGFVTPVLDGVFGLPGVCAAARAFPGRQVTSASIGAPHAGQKPESSETGDEQLGQDAIGGL